MTTYTIVGADGRRYGPATADELREWIREHRADAATRVRRDGEDQWQQLGEVDEFRPDLQRDVAPEETADRELPPVVPGAGDRLAETILARGVNLQIGDCFSRGWELVLKRPGFLIAATLVIYLLYFGMGSIPTVGTAAVFVFSFVLLGGLDWVFLRSLRGGTPDMGAAFVGFGAGFVPLLLAGTVASTLSTVGLLLCIAPGVYLLVAWTMFAPLLILDKGLDFWQALECSRRVVTRYWWPFFGLAVLAALVIAAGALACGIGLAITLPLATAAVVIAYEDVFGRGPEDTEVPRLPALPGPSEDAPPTGPESAAEPIVREPAGDLVPPGPAEPPQPPVPDPVPGPQLVSGTGEAPERPATPAPAPAVSPRKRARAPRPAAQAKAGVKRVRSARRTPGEPPRA